MVTIKTLWAKYDDLVLEIARNCVLIGVAAVVTYLLSLVAPLREGNTFGAILYLVLKGIDRFLHEKTKFKKGLTQF